jgi:hypothetical protein
MPLLLHRHRSSIRPVPIPCTNRATHPSHLQHQALFRDIGLRPLRMDTYRVQPLALTDGHPSQKRARSTAAVAPWSLAQYRNLIPTITLLSVTAMVALGVELGTVIGFERRPVPDGQSACKDETRRVTAHVAKPPQLSIQKIERPPGRRPFLLLSSLRSTAGLEINTARLFHHRGAFLLSLAWIERTRGCCQRRARGG